ncbi:MAG: hypothetical protein ACK2U9_16975, partial [Anaerolineae bacterium]
FDAMVTAVEGEGFRIDRFLRGPDGLLSDPPPSGGNTVDWSFSPPDGVVQPPPGSGVVEGHYYANKAPGTILIGTAAYAATHGLWAALGAAESDPVATEIQLYLVNLFLSVLPVALAGLAIRRLALILGASQVRASVLAMVLVLATPLFPYETQLWGHPTSASFATVALAAAARLDRRAAFTCGFSVGMALLCDYFAVLWVILLGIWWAWRRPRMLAAWFLGGVLPALAFFAYHQVCFGSPVALATETQNEIFIDDDHALGIVGLPQPERVAALLLSRYRGLPVQVPLLLLSPVGLCFWWWRRHPQREMVWLILAGITSYVLANAAFNGWHAGSSAVARYQILALPLWVLALLWVPWRGVWRWVTAMLAFLSLANMMVLTLIGPLTPEWYGSSPNWWSPTWTPPSELAPGITAELEQHPFARPDLFYDPVYGWTWRELVHGRVAGNAMNPYMPLGIGGADYWHPTNLGLLMGLDGAYSVLPLLLMILLGGVWLLRSARGLDVRHIVEHADDGVLRSTTT